MKKVNLYDKSEEIFNKLPKRYAEMIINSVIVKSLNNGGLINEASIFLSTEDLKNLSERLDLKFEVKKKPTVIKRILPEKVEKTIITSKKEEKRDDALKSFEGFD